MDLEDEKYRHPGWLGAPYFSDFQARWGLVKLDEMMDCSHISMTREAAREAQQQGFHYFISQHPSRYGSWLYMIDGVDGRFSCVYAKLVHQQYQAQLSREKYSDLDFRITQVVRTARSRAKKKGLPFDLDTDDIIRRVRAGTCEATGVPFCLDDVGSQRNPFTPSLDRVDSRLGYTPDNVQVVCLGWNLMKTNFDVDLLAQFIDGWLQRRNGSSS